ncbi:hypothetical protein BVC71_07210 [Marivivens niveibacter]|uniref:Uncharacterized protein n=1 Tax=Marivivens niveibacter TaxID=1930667 RepID=A0A251WZ86_9RHOB|nr:hypothetical protein [Marivivens niveibacter]OUD09621.1 hypothetical protein BVC71_07210 [Marivivens niveibacter]
MPVIPRAKIKTLLSSNSDLSKASLATRIMLTRMRLEVSNSPICIDQKVSELESVLNSKPQIAEDLASI